LLEGRFWCQNGTPSCAAGSDSFEEPVPLPSIHSDSLRKVLEFCQRHKDDPPAAPADQMPKPTPSDEEWANDLDVKQTMELVKAANYLDIP
jgi:S-phase kinase-associated protein 1